MGLPNWARAGRIWKAGELSKSNKSGKRAEKLTFSILTVCQVPEEGLPEQGLFCQSLPYQELKYMVYCTLKYLRYLHQNPRHWKPLPKESCQKLFSKVDLRSDFQLLTDRSMEAYMHTVCWSRRACKLARLESSSSSSTRGARRLDLDSTLARAIAQVLGGNPRPYNVMYVMNAAARVQPASAAFYEAIHCMS